MDSHDGSHVPATIAIIWRRPNCDELLVEHVFVPFLHELMSAGYQVERVDVVELPV